MAADDDVFDLEDVHGELQHGKTIEVGVYDDVGDVAMDEQLAGHQVDDFVRRHPAVRAADPEVLGRLLAQQLLEEARILIRHPLRPAAIVLEQVLQRGLDRRRQPVLRMPLAIALIERSSGSSHLSRSGSGSRSLRKRLSKVS